MASHTAAHTENEESNVTSQGNNLVFSIVMTAVTLGLFAAGLWVMGLYTVAPVWFAVGLGMSIFALFIAFAIIPKYFTK